MWGGLYRRGVLRGFYGIGYGGIQLSDLWLKKNDSQMVNIPISKELKIESSNGS